MNTDELQAAVEEVCSHGRPVAQVHEVAEAAGVSNQTVRNYADAVESNGDVATTRIGGAIVFYLDDGHDQPFSAARFDRLMQEIEDNADEAYRMVDDELGIAVEAIASMAYELRRSDFEAHLE